ncbi:MAG TPA: hypothetical protein VKU88_04055 [Acidimicrobiales bacterium]|nr:hypothetical protein [Acidimicrobiales bacterium]
MSLILDAGAFLAVERGDRDVVALVKRERLAQRSPLSHGGVVAQVWRGGSGRQAALARLLPGVDVKSLDEELGRKAGLLLGRSRTDDAVDAALVCLAVDADEILTSDPGDLRALAEAAGVHVDLVPV